MWWDGGWCQGLTAVHKHARVVAGEFVGAVLHDGAHGVVRRVVLGRQVQVHLQSAPHLLSTLEGLCTLRRI